MKRRRLRSWLLVLGACVLVVALAGISLRYRQRRYAFTPLVASTPRTPLKNLSPFQQAVMTDLERQIKANIQYVNGYYAGGEPPAEVGVCTDVVIRSFRAAGVDLHQEVAADIHARRAAYPIARPDPNIDHRRCRNLVIFFQQHSQLLPTSGPQADWQPGDLVFWDTHGTNKADHVGMVGNGQDSDGNPTVVHHWPGLPVSETNGLTRFHVMYHFRWTGNSAGKRA